MNLVVNARDAMPDGGRLTVETSRVDLRAGDPLCAGGLVPGPHVMLAVADDGAGMDAATRARAFEPFFTTKPEGKGTGLGLATVRSIVAGASGAVVLDSEPGRGTTFRILLPRSESEAAAPEAAGDRGGVVGGDEVILLVEDDDQIRRLASQVLRDYGYRVFEIASPAAALDLVATVTCPIDLVLADVSLPGMSGPQMAARISNERPNSRVLFITGHAVGGDGRHRLPGGGGRVLRKPFTPDPLLRAVREVLDAPVPASAGRPAE